MTLETLQKDMIQARKDKDSIRKSVLSSAIGAIKKVAIDKQCRDNIDEPLVNEVLLKEKKMLQEQIDTCPINRVDCKEEFLRKMNVLEEYCPKLLDNPSKISDMIKNFCFDANIELTKANRDNVMRAVMPHFKGHADMKVVHQVIGGLLH